jgi:hypothetical protein
VRRGSQGGRSEGESERRTASNGRNCNEVERRRKMYAEKKKHVCVNKLIHIYTHTLGKSS